MVLASVALLAAVVSGKIAVVPRHPPEPLDARTVELLELWEEGRDIGTRRLRTLSLS